jgi:hypothetical protein
MVRTAVAAWRSRFWWRWIAANSLAELLGLGTVAAFGYAIFRRVGEPHGIWQAAVFALAFVALGALEGLVVGWAQAAVLKSRLPGLKGWVRASIIGAAAAWALGMVPSTIMSLTAPAAAGSPPDISEPLRLLLAAGLGMIAGPVLAFFQWKVLRQHVQRAACWLPANAVSWAVGMPIIFLGAHMGAYATAPLAIALGAAAILAIAGAVVGAIHGRVLIWLLPAEPFPKSEEDGRQSQVSNVGNGLQ